MKYLYLSVVVFSLTLMIHGQAQDLPSASEVFVDGVQSVIIEDELTPKGNSVQLDYEKQLIQFYENTEDMWYEFPYPDGVDYLGSARLRADGLIELNRSSTYNVDSRLWADNIFLLNPHTGLYEQPPLICQDEIIQSETDEGRWIVVYRTDSDDVFLCHSTTGQELDILSEELVDWRVSASPDNNWLILSGKEFGTGNKVFSYNIMDDNLTPLGVISRTLDDVVSVCNWVTDTTGLICNSDQYRSWPGVAYYAFDVKQADSLVSVFGSWGDNTYQMEDPTRYASIISDQYISSYTGSQSEPRPCRLITYDAEGLEIRDLDYECNPLWLDDHTIAPFYRNNDTIYFLTIASADSTIAELHAYDVRAQTNPDLPIFSGEIESILSVSPDGRYVVLLMDNNGELDFDTRREYCCNKEEGLQVVVIRVDSIEDYYAFDIVYRSKQIGVYMANQITWLDSNTLIIATMESREWIPVTEAGDTISHATPSAMYRITLGEEIDIAITTRYGFEGDDNNLSISPNNRYLKLSDGTITDLMTFEPIVLFREDLPDDFYYYTSWLDNSDLKVEIIQKSDYTTSVTYHINWD